jgi:membrane protease YdiL (CAAX protease family)
MPEKKDQLKTPMAVTAGPVGTVFLVIFIFFGADLFGNLLVTSIPPALHWSTTRATNWEQSYPAAFLLSAVAYSLAGFTLWWWFLRGKPKIQKLIGLKDGHIKDAWLAPAGLIAYFVIVAAVIGVLERLIPDLRSNAKLVQQLNVNTIQGNAQIFLGILGLCVIDPIIEELTFRGFVFTGFKQRFSIVWAAILTSLLFAIPHMLESTQGILYEVGLATFIMSLILCWIREQTGNIYVGMLLHGGVNFIALMTLLHQH